MRNSILVLALTLGIATPGVADNAPSIVDTHVLLAQAEPDAGVAIPPPPADPSQPPAPEVKPSDKLHDPTTDPVGAWSDAKAAKKVGWTAFVFALATMLAIGVGTLGKSVKQLAWLAKGRWAVVVGGVVAVGAACYDVAMAGGSLVALAMAAWSGFLAYWNSHREPTEASK